MSAELVNDGDDACVHPGLTPLALAPPPQSSYQRWVKPVLDRAIVILLLPVIAPVSGIIAAIVAIELGRPVLFRQERVGRHGRRFTVHKFRSMRQDRRGSGEVQWPGDDRRLTHKSSDDPRHTRIGRMLRKSSLDELPQLWNVLKGDMSLVGPRPELTSVVRRYEPWQHRRHDVKPGLTGPWQISERGTAPMHEATHLDLQYVDSVSLRTDLAILLRTPVVVLLKRNGS
jgi:lipopolysaccharide/colanic/teichoic acid biosynthesis glycosyltransferase